MGRETARRAYHPRSAAFTRCPVGGRRSLFECAQLLFYVSGATLNEAHIKGPRANRRAGRPVQVDARSRQ